jgi:hypothetical protein
MHSARLDPLLKLLGSTTPVPFQSDTCVPVCASYLRMPVFAALIRAVAQPRAQIEEAVAVHDIGAAALTRLTQR